MRCCPDGRPVVAPTCMSPVPGFGRVEQLAQAVAERVVSILIDALDIDSIVKRIDVDSLIDRVDVDKIIDRVDVDKIIDRVDVEKIIDRVDVEKIIDRVDVEKIIDRVDVEKIIDRVDVEKIIDRVDIDKIIDRVDVDSLMEQTELGAIIARSTTSVASDLLDVVRAQGVGLDDFFARWANRTLRRTPADLPLGPPTLVEDRPAVSEQPSGVP
jgi:hypothetical protein